MTTETTTLQKEDILDHILENGNTALKDLLSTAFRCNEWGHVQNLQQSLLDRFIFRGEGKALLWSFIAIASISVSSRGIGVHPSHILFEDILKSMFRLVYGTNGPVLILDKAEVMFPGNEDFFKPSISNLDLVCIQSEIIKMINSKDSYPPEFYAHWDKILSGELPYGITLEETPGEHSATESPEPLGMAPLQEAVEEESTLARTLRLLREATMRGDQLEVNSPTAAIHERTVRHTVGTVLAPDAGRQILSTINLNRDDTSPEW